MGGGKNRGNKPSKKIAEYKKGLETFVSICTPTFNRRPFISHMIKCFEHQDYPKEKMEWIIIDDGTDKIGDLVKHIPQVKYFAYDTKMCLGEKRNIMHEKSKGNFIVYMDDDDYYPPDRVSHAVATLQANPHALCAGSSIIHIYFKHINQMYKFGPYGPNHATAGTFAFRREMLKEHKYENKAALAEEKVFLKNYTVPFVQLDSMKSILVFSHEHNTFDKRILLENPHPNFVAVSDKTVEMFIPDAEMRDFYMNQLEKLLVDYVPGRPDMKPDVIKQIKELSAERAEMMKNAMANGGGNGGGNGNIMMQQPNGQTVCLNNEQVVKIIQQQQNQINMVMQQLNAKDNEIRALRAELDKFISNSNSNFNSNSNSNSNTNITTTDDSSV